MATTEPEDLVETIRSRSQHFHFRALSFAEIVEALGEIAAKKDLEVEEAALAVMARAADGSLRDAMSLLEQARAYCGAAITEAQVREFLGIVAAEVLDELVAAIENAFRRARAYAGTPIACAKARICNNSAAKRSRIFATCSSPAFAARIRIWWPRPPKSDRDWRAPAAVFSEEDLTRFFQILLLIEDDLRRKPDPRLHLEMGLLRLVNTARLAPLEEVLSQLSGQPVTRASTGRIQLVPRGSRLRDDSV